MAIGFNQLNSDWHRFMGEPSPLHPLSSYSSTLQRKGEGQLGNSITTRYDGKP